MADDLPVDSPAPVAPAAEVPAAPVAVESAPVTEAPAAPVETTVEDLTDEPQITVLCPEVKTLEQQLGVDRVDVYPTADHGFSVHIAHYRISVSLEELQASGDIVAIIREKYQALLPQ
jgi:hypothetical protein